MERTVLLIIHTLAACVWVGGHLILALTILPRAWKTKDVSIILTFEGMYERIGIPALVLQVVTGIWLATFYAPASEWLHWSNPITRTIMFKLGLLLLTVVFAIHARFFIIPTLTDAKIPLLGTHILAVTLIATIMLFLGLNFRLGML